MAVIPRSHPRYESLMVREKLVRGFEGGLVAREGLMAHGRGEAFDYLLGERTGRAAKKAIGAAAAALLLAERPVISVNGNMAALCPRETVRLAKITRASIEVNLFYSGAGRKQRVADALKRNGAQHVLGLDSRVARRLPGLDSARRTVDADGILRADLIVVPLEDGDRTEALKKAGKTVIAFDLNPLSRTARAADITIVDNVSRAVPELVMRCREYSARDAPSLRRKLAGFDNAANLASCVHEIGAGLTRRFGRA